MSVYNRFARTLRRIYSIIHPRWKADAPPEDGEPVVYVVHHQNMFGPVHAVGLMHAESHLWAYSVFCSKQACFDQFYGYTFTERFGWPRPFAYAVAKLLSAVVPYLMQSLQAVPVYHDAQSIVTMRRSLEYLKKGENLTICPDLDYASSASDIGEMYSGFTMIGEFYQRQTGKRLKFVPVYCSKKTRRIVFGEALCLDDALPRTEARYALVERLRSGVNGMGEACGDIVLETGEKESRAV